MKIGIALLAGALSAALAGVGFAAPKAAPEPKPALAPHACVTLGVPIFSTVDAPLALRARAVDHDPSLVWSDFDLWNLNAPAQSGIYEARVNTCVGELIISQLVNRQCWSAFECPVRVVLQGADGARTMLGYRQMCTRGETFSLDVAHAALLACNQAFALY